MEDEGAAGRSFIIGEVTYSSDEETGGKPYSPQNQRDDGGSYNTIFKVCHQTGPDDVARLGDFDFPMDLYNQRSCRPPDIGTVGRDLNMADTMNLAYNQTINNPTVNHVHQATVNHVHQATVNMQGDMGRTVLLEQSKADIESDRKLFVETEAHRKAMEEMTSHHCLLIIGSTGTGKTTQGHAILRECQNQGRTPFNLHSPAEWRRYIRGKNEIVLIDDIFGKDSYSHKLCEAWSRSFCVMQTFCSNSGCFIVMTLRSSVREEALRQASGVRYFFKRIPVVDLNEHQFTESEKTQMLINHMEAEGKVMHQDDLDIVLYSDNSGSQFPTCCKEYAMMSVDTPNKTKIFAQFQEVTGNEIALQLASKRGQEEIVMGLLTRGVDVDSSDSEGWTALHHACCEGHMNDVILLLKDVQYFFSTFENAKQ